MRNCILTDFVTYINSLGLIPTCYGDCLTIDILYSELRDSILKKATSLGIPHKVENVFTYVFDTTKL